MNTDAKFYTEKKIKWTNDPINTLGIDLSNDTNQLSNNYDKIITNLETVCNIWFYRSK